MKFYMTVIGMLLTSFTVFAGTAQRIEGAFIFDPNKDCTFEIFDDEVTATVGGRTGTSIAINCKKSNVIVEIEKGVLVGNEDRKSRTRKELYEAIYKAKKNNQKVVFAYMPIVDAKLRYAFVADSIPGN